MERKKLEKILEEQINCFIDNIAIELEESHNQWFDDFGFPMFGETSKDYHEQVYFQSYLESYIRLMINSTLKELLETESANYFQWPELEHFGIYKGYTNTECEKEFDFEFIDLDAKVGYRYTYFQLDEMDRLLANRNIDTIKLVIWENDESTVGTSYADERIEVILLWELFQELFSDLRDTEIRMMYEIFVERIAKAIEKANSMISLTTIPGFTPSFLHQNRACMIQNLENDVNNLTVFHVYNRNYKTTEYNSKTLISKYKLPQRFLKMKMEYAFVGNSPYAKSFMTSEYLYNYFKNNPMFDYTPIISGYIKSIEQLLYEICHIHALIQDNNIDMHSYTLGGFIKYIEGNNGIFREEIQPATRTILACLDSYRVEIRNRFLHRKYFSKWETVKTVRTNTIFLYAILLGAINENILNNPTSILHTLYDNYDRLFQVLDKDTCRYYSIILNGKEYIGWEKSSRTKGVIFDDNGMIKNTIKFRKLGFDQYDEIEISKDNMPSAIWGIDSHGKATKINW